MTSTPPPTSGLHPSTETSSLVRHDAPPQLVTKHAIMAGLTGLLPIPFVDDWLLRAVQRRMLRALLEHEGVPLPRSWSSPVDENDSGLSHLLASSLKSTSRKIAYQLLLFPLRKVARKVLYVFAIRDCIHRSTHIFAEGYLYIHALREGYLPRTRAPKADELASVALSIERALEQTKLQPTRSILRRFFSRSWSLLIRTTLSYWRDLPPRGEGVKPSSSEKLSLLAHHLHEESVANSGFQEWLHQLQILLWGDRSDLSELRDNFTEAYHTLAPLPNDPSPSSSPQLSSSVLTSG